MLCIRIIATLALAPISAIANVACYEAPPESIDLDQEYESASVVFVATVTRDRNDEAVLRYTLHSPPLKGTVPETGELVQNNLCWSMSLLNDSGIVLFFLDSVDQPVSVSDWQLVSLGIGKAGLTWVSDWLRTKSHDLE
jgi:hypothetical protein